MYCFVLEVEDKTAAEDADSEPMCASFCQSKKQEERERERALLDGIFLFLNSVALLLESTTE